MQNFLESTPLLDFRAVQISSLIAQRGWTRLSSIEEKINAVYDFVRNEIQFGYNAADNIAASKVLADGYGQCNTKTTLLMALLRALAIECRFHGALIDKALQRGAVTGIWYKLAPALILHSWVEVLYDTQWRRLEGVIIDAPYLRAVQRQVFKEGATQAKFVGYAIATDNIAHPQVEWHGGDTAIQREGIVKDLGIYTAPDQFYEEHGVNVTSVKRFLFSHFIRHRLNARVDKIRNGVVVASSLESK